MPSPSTLPPPRRGSVAVVGAGRLGSVMTRALRAAGVTVFGPTGRDELIADADVVLICVPDAEIAHVAATLRGHRGVVGHVSGATPVEGGDVAFGMHPLQTFTGAEDPDVFHGIGCAVAGRSPRALGVAHELATRLGMRAFPIGDDQRAGYHAAASLASNLVVALLAEAEGVLVGATGVAASEARALLTPLVRASVENWSEAGGATALTGPISRGDEATVARQRAAIAATRPEATPVFDALCASARTLAQTAPVTR